MRLAMAFAVLAVVSAPAVHAQSADPDKKVQAGGITIKGWRGEVDKSSADRGMKITDAKFFEPVAGAIHVTSGPPAYYWNPANVAKGAYTVKATFTQTKPTDHPEAYGLFMGGSKLGTADRNYLYLVVFGTGMYSIKHQFGGESHTLINRKASTALKTIAAGGAATNSLAIQVTADAVLFMINGTTVERFPKGDLIGAGKLESTDGVYGVRVNHNLDVHIADFGMTKE